MHADDQLAALDAQRAPLLPPDAVAVLAPTLEALLAHAAPRAYRVRARRVQGTSRARGARDRPSTLWSLLHGIAALAGSCATVATECRPLDHCRMWRSPVRLDLRRVALCVFALSFVAVGCAERSGSSADESRGAPDRPSANAVTSGATMDRCLLQLHGKGDRGVKTVVDNGISIISPDGNAEGWGARQWLYFPDSEYTVARKVVEDAVKGCGQVIIDGFSNGAAFAAKLYCRGETLGGRLVRVVVDDPVVDAAVKGVFARPFGRRDAVLDRSIGSTSPAGVGLHGG